jgi:hypothetical protein
MDRIGLKETIENLRSELSKSIVAAEDESLRFRVGEVTLELQLEVERATCGSGGIQFWVVSLSGEASKASTFTHKLSLSLTPVTADGRPVLTGSQTVPE